MELLAGIVILIAVVATLLVWNQLALRWWSGIPLLRYVPRRPVPWNGLDVMVVFGLLICVQGTGFTIRDHFLPARPAPTMLEKGNAPDLATPAAPVDEIVPVEPENSDRKHPLLQLLEQDSRVGVVLLCFLTGAVIVPLAEEFLFRLVLQGWGERVDRRLRRWVLGLRAVPPGVIPVLVVAVLFAALHARTPGASEDADRLIAMMVFSGIEGLATVGLGLLFLHFRAGASMADLGVVAKEIPGDIGRGLVAFLAVGIPLYGIQFVLMWLLPEVVPDPFTLFPFALVLGFLYWRTHRIVPALVLHMALNASSLTLALMEIWGSR